MGDDSYLMLAAESLPIQQDHPTVPLIRANPLQPSRFFRLMPSDLAEKSGRFYFTPMRIRPVPRRIARGDITFS